MKLDKYSVLKSYTQHSFEFVSEGQKGRIKKIVKFEKIPNTDFFNLAFGDEDNKSLEVDDLVVSNNGDSEKVLATVAFIVIEFLKLFPESLVYATGSTPTRTRLYQIGISNNLLEIENGFKVFGVIGNEYEPFERGKNYEGFVITIKTSIFDI